MEDEPSQPSYELRRVRIVETGIFGSLGNMIDFRLHAVPAEGQQPLP